MDRRIKRGRWVGLLVVMDEDRGVRCRIWLDGSNEEMLVTPESTAKVRQSEVSSGATRAWGVQRRDTQCVVPNVCVCACAWGRRVCGFDARRVAWVPAGGCAQLAFFDPEYGQR
jgi:hypothetical protein